MDMGHCTLIIIGCVLEFALASYNQQSHMKIPKIWIQDKSKAAYNKNINRNTDIPRSSITPQPSPSTEVNNRDIHLINESITSTTPSVQVYRHPFRNRTVYAPRGPRWDQPESVVQPTDKSDLPNSTFVGILTGATIVFMLVWLPCYLYSETCLGGRPDNASQGSSENLSEDLETSDHPPSYNEALSSRTVSTFSFSAQGNEGPPPSYDSLNVLIQDLDKGVCRVTASTSYYSYRPSMQTASVSSSRSFHGTESQFAPTSLYRTPKKLYKGQLPIRSLSFLGQPTLTEVHPENETHSSLDDHAETSQQSEDYEASGISSTSKDLDDDRSIDMFSDIPDYPPPTYREECGSTPSSDSSSLLTVIAANTASSVISDTCLQVEDGDVFISV